MGDSDIKQKPVFSSKKHLHYKKKWVIGIVIATVIVVVGAILAIAYLLPKTPSTKGGDITIGATTITQQQLSDYAKSIENYRATDSDFILEGDAKVIASDDLIMNAALKYYAQKYGQTVSNREVLAEAYVEVVSDAEADATIGIALGDALSLPRIRNENVAYQRKLAPYVFAMKSLFVMRTNFDTPYFTSLPDGEVQAAYDSAIAKLRTEILPLFNAKQSKEEIAKKADVNFFDDDNTDEQDMPQYSNGSVLGASYDEGFRADGQYYNNIDDPTGYVRGDVGQLFSMDEKIATLKNVGDFSDVFSSKTGEFVIVRLESKTDGEFNSWQEMLESFKKKYAYDSISKVISDVSYGTQVFIENAAKAIISIGVDKVSAVNCVTHRLSFNFYSIVATTQTQIGGTKVRFDGEASEGHSCPNDNGTTHMTITTKEIGYAVIHYNCWSHKPDIKLLDNGKIEGYKYLATWSIDHNTLSDKNKKLDPRDHPGWPYWGPWNNVYGDIYTRFLYKQLIVTPDPWGITPTIDVNKQIITPGLTIEWKHTVTNDGSGPTDKVVNYGYQNRNGLGEGQVSMGSLESGFEAGATEQFNSTYRITQNDVDKTLCRTTYAIPRAWDNSGLIESPSACVYIPYNYVLTPSITNNAGGNAIEAGTTFNVTPLVTNSGPTKSKPTQWQITEIVVAPGSTVSKPAGGDSDQSVLPFSFFQCVDNCKNISSGNDTVFDEKGARLSGSAIAATAVTLGDYDIGTHICYAFSVQPRASSVPENKPSDDYWIHSAPVCLVISKKPKAQIWGGDLSVGGLVQTSTSTKVANGGRTFGSWVEYGMFATGSITGMASGSAFAGPGLANATVCSFSTLSFTNADSSACGIDTKKGYYTTTGSIADIATNFPGAGATISADTIAANDLIVGSGTYVGTRTGNLTLTQSELAPGKSIILKVSGTVTIAGNQIYNDGPYTAISQLPQLIIIADKIIINSDVTRVDAWLIANGVNGILETCNTGSLTYELTGDQRLTIDKCKDQLTVNGPVMAKQLWLRRTYGSGIGDTSGTPAEIFNLRADAYLWSIARATSSGHVQTVYTTELPPRF